MTNRKKEENMNENILNLDAFVKEPRVLVYKGKKYEIGDISFKTYLEILDLRQKITNTLETEKQLDLLIEVILKVVPDLPREDLQEMTIKQLTALATFISKDIEGGSSEDKNFQQSQ